MHKKKTDTATPRTLINTPRTQISAVWQLRWEWGEWWWRLSFYFERGTMYEIYDEHNCSDEYSEVSKNHGDSSISAQAAGESLNTDDPNSLVDAKWHWTRKKSNPRRKKGAKLIGKRLGLTILQANLDIIWMSLLRSFVKKKIWMTPLPAGERRPKWILTNLSSTKICCIREPEIDWVRICCYFVCLCYIGPWCCP